MPTRGATASSTAATADQPHPRLHHVRTPRGTHHDFDHRLGAVARRHRIRLVPLLELGLLVAGDHGRRPDEAGFLQQRGGHRHRCGLAEVGGELADRPAQLVVELALVEVVGVELALEVVDRRQVPGLERRQVGRSTPHVPLGREAVEAPHDDREAEHDGDDAEHQPRGAVVRRAEDVVVCGHERARWGVDPDHVERPRCRWRSSSSYSAGTTSASPASRVPTIPSRPSVARVSAARRRPSARRSSWSRPR